MQQDNIDSIIDAPHAVHLVMRHYASGPDGVSRIDEIAEMLRARDRHGTPQTSLLLAVADAIQNTCGSRATGR